MVDTSLDIEADDASASVGFLLPHIRYETVVGSSDPSCASVVNLVLSAIHVAMLIASRICDRPRSSRMIKSLTLSFLLCLTDSYASCALAVLLYI